MQKNVFFKNISKKYLKLQKKAKQNIKIINWVKLWIVVTILLLVSGVHAYLVNVSSTRGYDLRQKEQKLARVQTQHDIVDIKVLQEQRKRWEDLHDVLKENYITLINQGVTEIIRIEVSEDKYRQIGFLQD